MNNKANKIREQRKSLTYSIRELATLTNVPENDIRAYESNKKVATEKTIKKIATLTNTKVSDWVDEDYFKTTKYNENILDKKDEELAMNLYRAMFRSDDVMETLYSALMDMQEIEITEDNEIVFSEFCKELFISIYSIKFKTIFAVCKINKIKEPATNNNVVKSNHVEINKKMPSTSIKMITFDNLVRELRILFKNTDVIKVIIQALIKIGSIDNSGSCSEKAKLLLDTILSNKIKNSIIKKVDV